MRGIAGKPAMGGVRNTEIAASTHATRSMKSCARLLILAPTTVRTRATAKPVRGLSRNCSIALSMWTSLRLKSLPLQVYSYRALEVGNALEVGSWELGVDAALPSKV